MPTIIGHEPAGWEKVMPFILGAMFFVGFGILIPQGQSKQYEQRLNGNCQQFKAMRITDVPARCVTRERGFRDE